MQNELSAKLNIAGGRYRLVGLFGMFFEYFMILAVVYILPLAILGSKNIYINFGFMLIALVLNCFYVFFTQKYFRRTFVQMRLKIYIVKTTGEDLQFRDIFKRAISKTVLFLFWLIPNAFIAIFLMSFYGADFKIAVFVKITIFFSCLGLPILMIPIINNKRQTIYDYLSSTLVLVNYEEIRKEERLYIQQYVNDPFSSLHSKANQNISIQSRLIALIIFWMMKLFKKK